MLKMLRIIALSGLAASGLAHAADALTIDVHRDANCSCCKDWIRHLEDNGFTVNDHVENNMIDIKLAAGVPPQLGSCHTAMIDGQFIEGHVPAEQIKQLHNRPDLLGLAVPGMPLGSPGMEYNGQKNPYQVIGLTRDGQQEVIAEY